METRRVIITVDGQRAPRGQPMELLPLRDPDILQIPKPLVFEGAPIQDFYEAGGWIDTERDELRQL